MDMVCNCMYGGSGGGYRCNCTSCPSSRPSRDSGSPTSDYKKNQVLVRSWRECKEGVKHNQRLDDDKDFECELQ